MIDGRSWFYPPRLRGFYGVLQPGPLMSFAGKVVSVQEEFSSADALPVSKQSRSNLLFRKKERINQGARGRFVPGPWKSCGPLYTCL